MKDRNTIACKSWGKKKHCSPLAEWAKPILDYALHESLVHLSYFIHFINITSPSSGAAQPDGVALQQDGRADVGHGSESAYRSVRHQSI
jgi:hypothetical protein